MKFEKVKKEEYVDMGYEEEQEIVTEKVEMHFIEFTKKYDVFLIYTSYFFVFLYSYIIC